MGVWPLAPGVICLPLVQSLWSVEGTCRTEATPSRAGNCGGGVGCAEGKAEELSLTNVTAAEPGQCLHLR